MTFPTQRQDRARWLSAGLAVGLAALACSPTEYDVDIQTSALNGELVSAAGPLTRKTLSFTEPNEALREADTDLYYQTVRIGADGVSGGTIKGALDTLDKFRNNYFTGVTDVVTRYYNRGDLGLGREMHCAETTSPYLQIACYVVNYAAGDDGSEFTFGLSPSIAFSNLQAGNDFATVAMVFRYSAPASNRVFFSVYNSSGALSNFAALDRHALSFKADPVGTPGVNFNLHIPSNCVACHGGNQYDPSTHSQVGALFLPFDLDQFEYDDVTPGLSRADQESNFKKQNEMVWTVAALSGAGGNATKNQLNTWYANTAVVSSGSEANEVFENSFDGSRVVAGWAGHETVYRSFVQRACRSCHIASPLTFNTEAQFLSAASTPSNSTIDLLCNFGMPHALQSTREFWLSSAPDTMREYLVGRNLPDKANQLFGCGPSGPTGLGVVTLDPPPIAALMTTFLM
jgi:hypothetical protein